MIYNNNFFRAVGSRFESIKLFALTRLIFNIRYRDRIKCQGVP